MLWSAGCPLSFLGLPHQLDRHGPFAVRCQQSFQLGKACALVFKVQRRVCLTGYCERVRETGGMACRVLYRADEVGCLLWCESNHGPGVGYRETSTMPVGLDVSSLSSSRSRSSCC